MVYFTTRDIFTNKLAIGVGLTFENKITGPYTMLDYPLVLTNKGNIDSTVLQLSNGTNYLVWKEDGNAENPPIPTWLWAQQLTEDGMELTGDKTPLLRNDLQWEGKLIEAPWFLETNGYFYLFYSGGDGFCSEGYSVGVARSKMPLGRYIKKSDPILVSNDRFKGPGHCSVVRNVNHTDYAMIHHAWRKDEVCGNFSRLLMASNVEFDSEDWPVVIFV